MKSNIPADQVERTQGRADELLEVLRRETERLGPEDDSVLIYSPEASRQ